MKKNKIYPDSPSSHRKWFQISFSLGLALFLFLIPLAVGRGFSLESASLPYFSIPLGPALVYATGGLTITKSAPAFVGQGQAITYTFRITNHTGQTLTEGTLLDNLPEEVDPSSCSDLQAPTNWLFFCDSGANAAGWIFIDGFSDPLPNGSAVTLQFVVTATSPLTDGHVIVNDDYRIDANGFSDIGAPVNTTIQAPLWAITKTVSSATIQPGQDLIYTITVTNIGPVSTTGSYTISDTLPNNTSPVFYTLPLSFTPSLAPAGTRSVTYSVRVDSPLPNGFKIVNDGYTVSGGGATAAAVNQPITVTVVSTSTLSISKIASANPITVGQLLTYTITLTNNATTGSAEGVVITDILPPQVTFQSASAGGVHSNGTIAWTLPVSLSPSSSTQVTVSGLVTTILPSPPRITNTFQASANNANPVAGFLTVDVKPAAPASINLVLAPSSISVCGTTVATATVRDNFANPVSGISVNMLTSGEATSLSPASGVTNSAGEFVVQFRGVVAGSANIGAVTTGLSPNFADSDVLTINSPPIPSSLNLTAAPNPFVTGGNTAVVTATLRDCFNNPISGGTVNFTLNDPALATFSGPSSGTTNASGTVTTSLTSNSTPLAGTLIITGTSGSLSSATSLNVLPPNTPLLIITKSANPTTGSTIETGRTITYTLVVTNSGTGAATGLVISDDLVAGLQFGGGNLGGTPPSVSGNNVTFSLANLAVNASTTATLSVTVTSAISGTPLSNVARAKSSNSSLSTSNIVVHTVTTNTVTTRKLYLPIISNP